MTVTLYGKKNPNKPKKGHQNQNQTKTPKNKKATIPPQSVVADMIKDLEMERLPWIIHVGPKCHHKCLYKREAEVDFTHTHIHTHTHTRK